MHLIAFSNLQHYATRHPETKVPLALWHSVIKKATWTSMNDVQASFSKATVLNGERLRFPIAGDNYRLIVAFDFEKSVAYVKFIGTHKEYDRVDALSVTMF